MQGVTTAIVIAIFAGIFWPHAIKNRRQFYVAIGAVLLIIFFGALDSAITSDGFARFVGFMVGLLQILGILAIILAASGQNVSEFAADTIEVIRRGEEEKEIIIPRRDRPAPSAVHDRDEDAPRRVDLGSTDDPASRIPLRETPPPEPPRPKDTTVPLE